MTKKKFIVAAIASCAWIATSFAATIPAGTTLIVRTLNSIQSTDRVGRTFTAQLDQDVAVNAKVVLRAGTKFDGKIESSQANPFRSGPLVLNVTDVSINGHIIPIKTVSGFEVQNLAMRAGARARGITVGPFVAPRGLRMEFRLAQPVKL
jgi:hypothetical protein